MHLKEIEVGSRGGKRKTRLSLTADEISEKGKERTDQTREVREEGLSAGATFAFTTGRQRAVYRMSFTWESLIGEELSVR